MTYKNSRNKTAPLPRTSGGGAFCLLFAGYLGDLIFKGIDEPSRGQGVFFNPRSFARRSAY
jgi:hypothetical protein